MLARKVLLVPPVALLLLASFVVASGPQPNAAPGFLFLSPNGSDSNPCTLASPCLSLPHAASLATPGTTVLVRGGTYMISASQTITATGTAGAPITFRPYQREVPRFDASLAPLGMYDSAVKVQLSQYVIVQGLTVCCSSGRGLTVSESSFVSLLYNTVTDTWDRAIGGAGDNITISYNTAEHVVLSNEDRSSSGGWSAAIASWAHWDMSVSRDFTFEGNEVLRSYGECYLAAHLIGFTFRFNHANGCYSVDLYVDRAQQGLIEANVFESTISGFERIESGRNAHGILFGSEAGDNPMAPSDIRVVSNVLGPGVGHGVSWWTDPENTNPTNSYHDLTIEGNRILGTQLSPVSFESLLPGGTPPCCNVLRDNVLSGTPDFADPGAWSVSGNVQWDSPDVPRMMTRGGSPPEGTATVQGPVAAVSIARRPLA